MFQTLKNRLYSTFPSVAIKYHAYQRLIANQSSYLYQTGWIQNLLTGIPNSVNAGPVPWMNYSFMSFLDQRLSPNFRLLEFGSGQSTLYFASRVSEVVSIEYDASWLQYIQQSMPSNVMVIGQDQDNDGVYCRAANDQGLFEVVVVDGRDRVNCCIQAVNNLNDNGVIILDDSQRPQYQNAFRHLEALNFKHLTIQGLKPTGTSIDQTTVFYRSNNCLGI